MATEADCGWCDLVGPDEFGNYDLVENPDCPFHGEALAEVRARKEQAA